MVRVDTWTAAILFVAGLVAIFVVIPAQTGEGEQYGLPPSAYPTLGALLMTVCSAMLFVTSMLQRRKSPAQTEDAMPAGVVVWRHTAIVLAVLVVGYLLIRYLGFLIGGPVTIGAFMIYMGSRSVVETVAVSVAAPVVIYLFFWQLFSIPLP